MTRGPPLARRDDALNAALTATALNDVATLPPTEVDHGQVWRTRGRCPGHTDGDASSRHSRHGVNVTA
jgi:hypothetical protein